jgi:membrane-associated protease RseP (regulator of RpoE activity)
MSAALAIAGLVLIAALHFLAVCSVRWGVARIVGVRGVGFRPKRDEAAGTLLPVWKRIVCAAAILFSAYAFPGLLFAGALLWGGRVVLAPPEESGTRIEVIPGRAAEAAGLRDDDRVVSVGGEPVERWSEMAEAIAQHPGETIEVVIDRDGGRVALEVEVEPEGRIGVTLLPTVERVGPIEALVDGMQAPVRVAYALVTGLWRWMSGNVDAELGGPVMIMRESARNARPSPAEHLQLVAALDVYYLLPLALILAFVFRVRLEPAAPVNRTSSQGLPTP